MRGQMIQNLVDHEIHQLLEDARDGDVSVLAWNLENGFKGFSNYSDEELKNECLERGIKIKKS
jgi:hypothetical protein